MKDKIINQIVENLKQQTIPKGKYPYFGDKRYTPIEIQQNNFYKIKSKEKESDDVEIAFIDGGNQEVLGSNTFSLQLIRTVAVVYKNKKRITTTKKEFFALTSTKTIDNELFYTTEYYTENSTELPNITIDSKDKHYKKGNNRIDIQSVADIIRRHTELIHAKEIAEQLNKKSIMILDGNLRTITTEEQFLLEQTQHICKEKEITIAALSKTCSIFTDQGSNFITTIEEQSPKDSEWYYCPIAEIRNENHKAEIIIAKLHNKSEYTFKIELYKDDSELSKEQIERTMNALMHNSTDPVFIGYPYGLIDADKQARVGNDETETLKFTILTKTGKEIKNVKKFLNAKNAHDILDNIA